MTGHDELEVQLWRRALLLTGGRAGAARVLARVLGAQDDARKLSAHRRDRLLIQAAREWVSGSLGSTAPTGEAADPVVLGGATGQLWRAVRELPRQPAEAWMLLDVEGLSEIDAARAMDCSRTAMQRHREAALASIEPLLGVDLSAATEGVRAALVAADPAGAFAEVRRLCAGARRRRRLVSLGQVALLAACMGVLVWVAVDLLRANERERERHDMGEQYSLPIGTEAPAPTPPKERSK